MVVFLHGLSSAQTQRLRRYLVAYDGSTTTSLDSCTTHLLCARDTEVGCTPVWVWDPQAPPSHQTAQTTAYSGSFSRGKLSFFHKLSSVESVKILVHYKVTPLTTFT